MRNAGGSAGVIIHWNTQVEISVAISTLSGSYQQHTRIAATTALMTTPAGAGCLKRLSNEVKLTAAAHMLTWCTSDSEPKSAVLKEVLGHRDNAGVFLMLNVTMHQSYSLMLANCCFVPAAAQRAPHKVSSLGPAFQDLQLPKLAILTIFAGVPEVTVSMIEERAKFIDRNAPTMMISVSDVVKDANLTSQDITNSVAVLASGQARRLLFLIKVGKALRDIGDLGHASRSLSLFFFMYHIPFVLMTSWSFV